jgi:soluble lytic murein transglycosylase-like protein
VPGRYRAAIARASLATGVPAVLLAAQLRAESNFDPGVVSSAGAQGIAQFMPATAASYGLRDPFDPYASIAAQARMMAELLKEFGSPALALAAYNAGPGAVGSCRCIPPYPETQTYVARILALIGDLGSLGPPGMEVELIG